MLAMRLCVLHNIYFYNTLFEKIRESLDEGKFEEFFETACRRTRQKDLKCLAHGKDNWYNQNIITEVQNRMNSILLAGAPATGGAMDIWVAIGYMVVIVGIFYLLLILPQNKKKKKEEKMRSSVQIGDEITTIGGVVGKVVGIKEDDSACSSLKPGRTAQK